MLVTGILFVVAYLIVGEYLAHLCYYDDDQKHSKVWLHSVASGVLLAAVFLEFFHRVYTAQDALIYICITLATFTFFYGLTHHVKHAKSPSTVMIAKKEIHLFHFLFILLHYFVIGALFAYLAGGSDLVILLVGVPLLMVKAVGGLEHVDKTGLKIKHKVIFRLSVIMSVLGFSLTYLTPLVDYIFLPAISFVAGGIFHLIITELFKRFRVNISYMIIGEVTYGLLIAIPLILGIAA
jgi:small-conductance mechanosensitive channel